jgi:hypothetical protein
MGSYKYISPDKELYLGHMWTKNGKTGHDKRCDYCGKWFAYDMNDAHTWGNNRKYNKLNGRYEKIHCGSEHCKDYHEKVLFWQEKKARMDDKDMFALFTDMKNKRIL